MTYGEVFQDKDIINNYLSDNLVFLNEFKKYLEERVALEKNYVNDSNKLIQKYTQKFVKKRGQSISYPSNTPNPLSAAQSTIDTIGENSVISETNTPTAIASLGPASEYSYVNAWRSILNQMEASVNARTTFHTKVTENVIKKLSHQIETKDKERNKNLVNYKNITNEIERSITEKNNAKKKYYDSCELMMNHKKKLNKQDSALNDSEKVNDKGLKKIEKLIDSTKLDVDNKKNLYILSLQALNSVKRKINNEYVPEIYNNLQAIQESMINDFQVFSKEYVRLEQSLTDDIKSNFDIALNDINIIDPANDNVVFENENRKEIVPIEDEKYVGMIGDENGDFIITDKSSIYLGTASANLQNQLIEYYNKFNSVKAEYDQFQNTYGSYVNDPSKMDAEGMRETRNDLLFNMHVAEIPIIINESKIEAINKAVGEEVKTNSHTFKSAMFINSTHCDFCGEKLRGIGKAVQCKVCNFVCHKECEPHVPQRCTGIKMDRKALRIGNRIDKDGSLLSPSRSLSISNPEPPSTDSSKDSDSVPPPPPPEAAPSPLANAASIILEEEKMIDEPLNDNMKSIDCSTTENLAISSPMCAIFEYQPQNPDEISLTINETVEVLEAEVDGWVKVKTSNGEGFVPSTYIAPIKTAIYSYEPQKEDEIAINEGDSVVVLGQEDVGWVKVKKGSLEGIVPETYIDM